MEMTTMRDGQLFLNQLFEFNFVILRSDFAGCAALQCNMAALSGSETHGSVSMVGLS